MERADQLVSDEHVRSDFTRFSAMTPEKLQQTKALVNQATLEGISMECRETPIEETKRLGAMALPGEKYGDAVYMISAGEFSRELYGSTYIGNTTRLGLFRVVFESSVAVGVRRIEGVTGISVLVLLSRQTELMQETAMILKANNVSDLVQRAK